MNQTLTPNLTKPTRYATRQPVLAADGTVIGYKLLFRTDIVDHFSGPAAEDSGAAAIDMSTLLGLDVLCDKRLAFIGCNRDVLLQHGLAMLPPAKVVAEIDPSVSVDDSIYQLCCDLKNDGYKIALTDFTFDDPREPLAHFADYVSVDMARTPREEMLRIAGFDRWRHSGMIATSVESREEFDFARKAGFQFFVGNFFRKPERMRTRSTPTNRVIYLRLLEAVMVEDLDWNSIEDLIKSDATIYYRLIRFLNSAALGIRCEVKTVRQALAFLGDNEIRRWCRLAGMFEMSQGRPSELMLSALIRARFLELIGKRTESSEHDLFLIGLLTQMDAVLEVPMPAILEGLHLEKEVEELLLDHTGPLQPLLDLIIAMESGLWGMVQQSCQQLGIEEDSAAAVYSSAISWAQEIQSSM